MSESKNINLARFLKTILDIGFGTLVFACIVLVLWIVLSLSPIIIRQMTITGTANVPVKIGAGEESQLEVNFANPLDITINASYIKDASGSLILETTNVFLITISNCAKLIVAVGLAYILHLLRSILQQILDGNPFAPENALRMRQLGYTVLILGIVRPTVEHIAANEILNRLNSSTPILSPGPGIQIETILTSLLILLLAYIWNYGLELERDKALTV